MRVGATRSLYGPILSCYANAMRIPADGLAGPVRGLALGCLSAIHRRWSRTYWPGRYVLRVRSRMITLTIWWPFAPGGSGAARLMPCGRPALASRGPAPFLSPSKCARSGQRSARNWRRWRAPVAPECGDTLWTWGGGTSRWRRRRRCRARSVGAMNSSPAGAPLPRGLVGIRVLLVGEMPGSASCTRCRLLGLESGRRRRTVH